MKSEEQKKKACDRAKRSAAKKIAAGLCVGCGKLPLFTKRLCEVCYRKNRPKSDAITNARRRKNRESGLCQCGGIRLPNKKLCQICSDRSSKQTIKNDNDRDSKGLCRRCGKFPKRDLDNMSSYCIECCLKAVCKQTLGDSSRHSEIKKLFVDQNGICPYTKMNIRIADTASLDHKIPKSRGGTHDLENLQWVHWWVNTAKSDLSEEEFLKFVVLVSDNIRQTKFQEEAGGTDQQQELS